MSKPHVVSWPIYLGIFLILAVLTAATVWAAGHDFGSFNTLVALTIAVVKATLVVLYFMHLRYSPRLTILVVFMGLVWLAILILLTLSDYLSRGWSIVTR
jgi:cytochrome c oxidase subunit 4